MLLLGPDWFFRFDIWADIFSIVVLFFIAFFATKAYQLIRHKKYVVFMVSIYMIVLGVMLKVVSNYFAYITNPSLTGLDFVREYALAFGYSWFSALFMIYELLVLVGFYFLYHVYNRQESSSSILLVTFLIAESVILSFFINDIFHLTALLILALLSARYWRNYHYNHLGNSALLAVSFSMIAIGELMFLLSNLNPIFYIVAEAVQLLGYLLLLVTFIMILIHGKKKEEQTRHRH